MLIFICKNKEKDYLTCFAPHIISVSAIILNKNPFLVIVNFLFFRVLFQFIAPKDRINILKAIKYSVATEREKAKNNLTQSGVKLQEIESRGGKGELDVTLEQGNPIFKSLKGLEHILSVDSINMGLLSAISSAIKKSTVPQGVAHLVGNETRYNAELNADEYLWFLTNNFKSDPSEYKNFLRTLLIYKELNFFTFNLIAQGVEQINRNYNMQAKQVFVDNVIGDIVNCYKIINSPINLLRCYYNKDFIENVVYISKVIHNRKYNNDTIPHILCLNNKESSIYIIYAIMAMIPFVRLNNIDLHNDLNTIFKQFAIEGQKNNLYNRLVTKPDVLLKGQHFVARFVLIMMKLLVTIVGINDSELTLNVISISHLKRDINDLSTYVQAIKYIDMIPFQNKTDIVLAFAEGFVDQAIVDRFSLQVISPQMNMDEFFHFFRHEFFEYCAIYGNILPYMDMEMGHGLYLLANRMYNRIRSNTIEEQRSILRNLFDFFRNNHTKFSFRELIDVF